MDSTGAAPSASTDAGSSADLVAGTSEAGTSEAGGIDARASEAVHVPGQPLLPREDESAPDIEESGVGASSDAQESPGTPVVAAADPAAEPAPIVDLAASASAAAPAARGAKRGSATRKSAKKAPPRRAGEPAAQEVTSAPARAKSSTVPAEGADTARLDAKAVRQWAATNGITVPARGPLSTAVREQYLAAN
ncbi:Lsr2 family DNA-binding protein [Kineococcus gypseus]|uniref:Lsr2 family DNA-binding protein n=1 Tax=Kineococcus gypseus TaxID=1637102 RepID=UPI003D7C74E7